jgi:hypothetical protein
MHRDAIDHSTEARSAQCESATRHKVLSFIFADQFIDCTSDSFSHGDSISSQALEIPVRRDQGSLVGIIQIVELSFGGA